jgi:putative heme degradation protein
VSELLCDGGELRLRDGRLDLETAHFHLHVDTARIRRAWFMRRGERLRGVYFVDAAGAAVFTLSLVRPENALDHEAAQRFEQDWQALTPPEPELASHARA